METRKQLETEMETQPCNCCSPNKISVLLTFISRHSRALPSSSLWSLALLAQPCSQAFATSSISVLENTDYWVWHWLGIRLLYPGACIKEGLGMKPSFASHTSSNQIWKWNTGVMTKRTTHESVKETLHQLLVHVIRSISISNFHFQFPFPVSISFHFLCFVTYLRSVVLALLPFPGW